MSDTQKHHHKLHEVKRHSNEEETHPFIANLFFCYLFPYICRCTPVTDPDIPAARPYDATKDATKKLKSKWQPEYEQFAERRRKYEEKIKQNPGYPIPHYSVITFPYFS